MPARTSAPVWKQYMEGADAVGDIPMAMMVPDIPGSLNLRHPDACQALLDAAAGAGATVVRGVRDVALADGERADGDVRHERSDDRAADHARRRRGRARVDGAEASRASRWSVRSRSSYIAGLLVDGLEDVPDDHDVVGGRG